MADNKWIRVEARLPRENIVVLTKSPGGIVQDLVYYRRLWWHPDKSMYIYYTPKFWKAKEPSDG